jgi:patatin-like phospholipase/acyl hydrolase
MGAFSASVLATYQRECPNRTGKGLVDHFDLITGTSTSGIIAIGLAMGAPAEQILEFCRVWGAGIFPRTPGVGGWLRTFGSLFRPRHT